MPPSMPAAMPPSMPASMPAAMPPSMPPSMPAAMLGEAWLLEESVALRPEPFGALAYHFGTRRLSFLKTPELVDVVRRLGRSPSVEAALTDAGVPEPHWTAYVAALRGLAAGGMISRRDPA